MHFQELEKFKIEYPSLNELIELLDDVLQEKVVSPTRDIVPPLLAKRLSIDEGLALALLMLVHEAGLIEPKYLVYCEDTDNIIGEYESLDKVPDKVFCPYHDKEHDSQEYYVELTFQFTPKSLSRYAQALS